MFTLINQKISIFSLYIIKNKKDVLQLSFIFLFFTIIVVYQKNANALTIGNCENGYASTIKCFTQTQWDTKDPLSEAKFTNLSGWNKYSDIQLANDISTTAGTLSLKSTTAFIIKNNFANTDNVGRFDGTRTEGGMIMLDRIPGPNGIINNLTTGTGENSSMKIDSQNGIHVVYKDNGLLYYRFSPGGASFSTGAKLIPLPSSFATNSIGDFNSIAIDEVNKKLYVVYFVDKANSYTSNIFAFCDFTPGAGCAEWKSSNSIVIDNYYGSFGGKNVSLAVTFGTNPSVVIHLMSTYGDGIYYNSCVPTVSNQFCAAIGAWSKSSAIGYGDQGGSTRMVGAKSGHKIYSVYYISRSSGRGNFYYASCDYALYNSCRTKSYWSITNIQRYVGYRYRRSADIVVNNFGKVYAIYDVEATNALRYFTVEANGTVSDAITLYSPTYNTTDEKTKETRIALDSNNSPVVIFTDSDGYLNLAKPGVPSAQEYCKGKSIVLGDWKCSKFNNTISGGYEVGGIGTSVATSPVSGTLFVAHYDFSNKFRLIATPPLVNSGRFTSNPILINMPGGANWTGFAVKLATTQIESGTSMIVRVRTSNSSAFITDSSAFCQLTLNAPSADGIYSFNFSSCSKLAVPDSTVYLQFQLDLTSDALRTISPIIKEVTAYYSRFPTAPASSPYLISSAIEMGTAANAPIVGEVVWRQYAPVGTKVRVQLQTSNGPTTFDDVWYGAVGLGGDASFSTDYGGICASFPDSIKAGAEYIKCKVGPDNQINKGQNSHVKYKIILESFDGKTSPEVFDVGVHFAINSPPIVSNVTISDIGEEIGAQKITYNISDEAGQNSFNVSLFYDVGLRLDTNPSVSGTSISIKAPSGYNLQNLIPREGVLAIDDEQIKYHYVGSSYVSGLSLADKPLERGAFSTLPSGHEILDSSGGEKIVWVRATDSEMAVNFGYTSQVSGDTGSITGGSKTIRWNPGKDINTPLYNANSMVRIFANDGQLIKQVGVGDSNKFILDTKPPQLSGEFTIQNPAADIVGVGLKVKTSSVTLSMPSLDTTDDNTSGNKMFFCNGSVCGSPSASAFFAGTASGWSPKTPISYASTYTWSVFTTPNVINLAAVDENGNITFKTSKQVVVDNVSPPVPTGFVAQDISSSLGKPSVYLKWDPLVWTGKTDPYGRQDFASIKIFRDQLSCESPISGFCEITSLSNSSVTSFVDEQVADKITYNYRILAEDDVGNLSNQVGDVGIPKSNVVVSLDGGPKIIPKIQNVRKVLQSVYTDPIVIYWDTVDESNTGSAVASDSRVAYIKSSSQPADFSGAPTQGSSELKSVGVADAQGNCTCHKVTLVGLEPGATYYLEYRSTAGKETGTLIDSVSFTTLQEPAKLEPAISNIQVTNINTTGATITWDTKYPSGHAQSGQAMVADSFVEYGASQSLGSYAGSKDPTANHSVSLSGLLPGQDYYFRAHSFPAEQNGKDAVYPSYGQPPNTFKTSISTEDKNAPGIENISVCDIKSNTASICWDTTEEASAIVEFWTGTDPHVLWESNPGERMLAHRVQLPTNLTPSTSYSFNVISYDTASPPNRAEQSGGSFDTLAPAPIDIPSVSNIRNDAPSPNSVVIYWDTNVDSDSAVFYAETQSGIDSAPALTNPIFTKNHIVTITELAHGKQYFYKVRSTNANGQSSPENAQNKTCGGNMCSFTTPLVPEPSPDVVPGSISVEPSIYTATIRWNTRQPGSSLVEFGINTVEQNGIPIPIYERGFFGNAKENVIQHVVNLPNDLLDGAIYHFRVTTIDQFGQRGLLPVGNPTPVDDISDAYPSCDSDRYNCLDPTFTTTASEFTKTLETKEPLVISTVVPLSVTDTTAVIGWTTNRVADSEVSFGISSGYGIAVSDLYKQADGTTNFNALTRTHAITLTGLTKSTLYYFKVASTDIADARKEDDNGGAGYTFTTHEGTLAISQAELDQTKSELDALKVEEQKLRDQLAQSGISDAERAILQSQLDANLALQAQLQQQLTIDQIPPTISNIAISDITETTATITWDTNEDASPNVRYGETSVYTNIAGDATMYSQKHTVKLSKLYSGTEYHFSAVAYDTAGNMASSDDQTFTTKGVKKTFSEEELLNEESLDDAIKKLSSRVAISAQNIVDLLKDFSEEEVTEILKSVGLQLISPPQFVEGNPIVDVTQTGATISWKTDRESDSRVAYAPSSLYKASADDPYSSQAGDSDVFTKEHKVEITGLEPGTLYHYQLRSRERGGRTANSIDRTFRTDAIKPEFGKISITDVTEHTAKLVWRTTVAAKDIVEYTNIKTNERRSQGSPQFLKNHEFVLRDLDPDTTFTATIKAEEETGLSTVSKQIRFNTAKDTFAPEISQMRTRLSFSSAGRGDTVQAIVSWKTNEPSTSQIFFAEGAVSGELKQSSTIQQDLTTTHVVVLSSLRPATIYQFRASSLDGAGNIGTSPNFKIITPRKKESVLELIISNFEDTFGFLEEVGR